MPKAVIPNTLAFRLFLLSTLTALIGVVVVAFVISADYRKYSEDRLRDVLVANVFNLMSTFEVDADGKLMGVPELGDSRYGLFDSGWYWSVENIDDDTNRIASISLADRKISVPVESKFDDTFQRNFEVKDETGQMLLGHEAQVFLGEGNNLYSFLITANKSTIDDEINDFRNRLALILSVFAFSIVLATYLAVKFSLRPLSHATQMLGDIRSGKAQRIDGKYPEEIQPFISETNALIDSNNTIVERARTQVGNLAHSLKTPLAVMQNELPMIKGQRGKLFAEQMHTMRQQVQVYLDRARISARSATAIASTPLVPVLEKLENVVGKLNPRIDISGSFEKADGVVFEGEKHDLQEIFGNLIENAAKYASTTARMSATYKNGLITVIIEDDGPGMSKQDIEKAKQRGGRIDEGKTGWGLGLSIVRDIVDEYDGAFELGKSRLGGLKSKVILPGRLDENTKQK